MKQIRTEVLTIDQANARAGIAMEPRFWEALVEMIAYPELSFDRAAGAIRFPSYVPFDELVREWLEGIEQGLYELRQCQRCAGYFDVNVVDGIFGRIREREEFICAPCAEAMTAREYFDRFVARGDVY